MKKEITIAACSAVALIILFGSVSYLLFPKVPAPTKPAPSVSVSPAFAVVAVGRSQLFTSSVSGGTSPYSYQWYLDGAAVAGATNSSWLFTPTSSGAYTVYVNATDKVGSIAKSNVATVQGSAPFVSISPTFAIVSVGQNQSFDSSVSGGTSPYSYQWYLDGVAVSGATNSSWKFTPASAGAYTVYVNITDEAGVRAESNVATVQAYTATLEVFTQLGWKGAGQSGGNFSISKNDTVIIYAEVRNSSNIVQGGCLISYEIHWPATGPKNGSIYAIGTIETNVSGPTEITTIPIWAPEFQVPSQNPQGVWLVYVTTSIDGQPLSDTLTFVVQE